ncbi:SDR family NAD(P)-dependent oxidoreductase [Paramixta manurensis]|uniref:SDR family NAD(P)-dependent oxidoreductase n=1 Tax=Paramixta manurensis TaxID=2740817 RepID=A0A6M8UDE8_9GAMM|nr:SDR family NAD(P)-dependent oxidoreductase [Erwiniaceae bacterium PD-1]
MTKQKVWFITGSSRGFGRVWAEAALQRGDKVVATARNIKSLAGLVESYGDAVLALQLDVTDRGEVFKVVNQAHKHFGRLDVILSNAGYGLIGAVEEVSLEDVRANFETNVFGTLSVIQAALPLLRLQGGGHILPVSSIGGVVTFPTVGLYQASKYAVEGMAETLASEVGSFGINVTLIEPGAFTTDFMSDASIKHAVPITHYDALRESLYTLFTPEVFGDPNATSEAILAVVDSPNPPLRLLLGSMSLPIIREVYAERLATWDKWAEVSNAAQGNSHRGQ